MLQPGIRATLWWRIRLDELPAEWKQRGTVASAEEAKVPGPEANPYPEYHQQYWPAPGVASAGRPESRDRDRAAISRISSTASTSTTRAQRGSPPPPETPVIPPSHRPQTDIEARYAAAGIAGNIRKANHPPGKISSGDEKLFQATAGAGAEIERHHHDANAVNGENDPVEGGHKSESGNKESRV